MTFDSARSLRKRASRWSHLPNRADSGAYRSELSRSELSNHGPFWQRPEEQGRFIELVVQTLGGRPAPLPGPDTNSSRDSSRCFPMRYLSPRLAPWWTSREVTGIDFEGDGRRGLVAQCRHDGGAGSVSLVDVCFEPHTVAGWLHAAYRTWLGFPSFPACRPSDWTCYGAGLRSGGLD
jgi:hypothetical protein